jgi:molecular chaperone DnaJ
VFSGIFVVLCACATVQLALKLHPDTNKDDSEAGHKFAEVSAAYEVLGDKEKRQMYDQHGHAAFEDGAGGTHDWQGMRPEDVLRHFGMDLGDMFGGMGGMSGMGGMGGMGGPAISRGDDIQVGSGQEWGARG